MLSWSVHSRIRLPPPAGKLVIESILETKARTILEFIQGLRGSLWVTFEEGTSAAWLYDLLKSHVAKVIICWCLETASTTAEK